MLKDISAVLNEKLAKDQIVKKAFKVLPSSIVAGNESVIYSILQDVASIFEVDIYSIYIIGSAHFGVSPTKKRKFEAAVSDLDLAVVDSRLYNNYTQEICKDTRYLSDTSKFPRKDNGDSLFHSFLLYHARGWLRPDLLPTSNLKRYWETKMSSLSRRHSTLFSHISIGIFASYQLFEESQKRIVP
ncbi:hypothetical protein KQI63_03105 [bacterium]|nr:hypothetical protein [bacterium]